jgi:hypothetical protein
VAPAVAQSVTVSVDCGDFSTAVVQAPNTTVVTLNDTAGATPAFTLTSSVIYQFPCSGEFSVTSPSGVTVNATVITSPWSLFTRNLLFGLAGIVGGALIAAAFIKAV